MIPVRHRAKSQLTSPPADTLSPSRPHRELASIFSTGTRSTAAQGYGAVILGGDCGSLSIARSLGRRGIPVCFITDNSNPIAKFSRYTSRSLSWAGSQYKDAVPDLIELADRYGMRGWALFPAADAEVQLVAQNHAELSKIFRLVTPPWDVAQWALDKTLTYQRARAYHRSCAPGQANIEAWRLDDDIVDHRSMEDLRCGEVGGLHRARRQTRCTELRDK